MDVMENKYKDKSSNPFRSFLKPGYTLICNFNLFSMASNSCKRSRARKPLNAIEEGRKRKGKESYVHTIWKTPDGNMNTLLSDIFFQYSLNSLQKFESF